MLKLLDSDFAYNCIYSCMQVLYLSSSDCIVQTRAKAHVWSLDKNRASSQSLIIYLEEQ